MPDTPDPQDHAVSRLELKVPPDLVAIAVALAMWLVSAVTPSVVVPLGYRLAAALVLTAAGMALIVAARVAFARAGTTFSPVTPTRAARLVTTGVYSRSRNPMYLGTLLVLLGLAAMLANPFSLVAPAGFVAYIDRFQIVPEERVLEARFGPTFAAYASNVRRWA